MADQAVFEKITNVCKNKYLPLFQQQINIMPSVFLEKIGKKPLTNHIIKAAAPFGLNGGFGFGTDDAKTPIAGRQLYKDFEQRSVDMFVNIEISDKVVKLASSNASSMVNVVMQELQGSTKAANWHIGRALFGNGTGILAKTTAVSSPANKVTVDDTKNITEGLMVDFYAGSTDTPEQAGRRVLSVDRVNKIVTFDGAATTLTAGFMTVQNSYKKELAGLGCIYDDAITEYQGIRKEGNDWIKPTVVDAQNDLTDIVIYDAVENAYRYKNAQIDLVMMGDAAFRAYQAYMNTSREHRPDNYEFIGGAKGYKVLVGSREVVIVNERFVPENEAWGVDTKAFWLESTPWDYAQHQSTIFTLLPEYSIYRALLTSYGNLMCENPGGCVRITNCQTA